MRKTIFYLAIFFWLFISTSCIWNMPFEIHALPAGIAGFVLSIVFIFTLKLEDYNENNVQEQPVGQIEDVTKIDPSVTSFFVFVVIEFVVVFLLEGLIYFFFGIHSIFIIMLIINIFLIGLDFMDMNEDEKIKKSPRGYDSYMISG